MPTIAIYEVYGKKYDQFFNMSKIKVEKYLKTISETTHIHFIEETTNISLKHPRKKIIIE